MLFILKERRHLSNVDYAQWHARCGLRKSGMANVLLVDDNTDTREAVAQHLKMAGHRVTTCPKGQEALSALTDRTPDVVVLDYKMPKMDGIFIFGSHSLLFALAIAARYFADRVSGGKPRTPGI
jgi:hypothetical protein